MNSGRLLIVEPDAFSQRASELLRQVFEVETGPLTRAELLGCIAQFDGVFVRLGHRLDAEFFDRASRLRFVASPTTGLNHIDLEIARERGIEILSLRGERQFLEDIHATAEFTWTLALALTRQVVSASRSVIEGDWDRDPFRGHELHGKTLGIVGFGRLGSKVANFGKAFGMRVVATDPHVALPSWVDGDSLEGVARRADVFSIHVSYGTETHGLISAEIINELKAGSVLINTARGEVLDEEALLGALRSRSVAGAALDVLSAENAGGEAAKRAANLKSYAAQNDNLIITPHIGGATWESMEKTELFVADKVLQKWQRL